MKAWDFHPHHKRRPLLPTVCSWFLCFFLPQVFSNPTNVSKFGSADFQQQLSNHTDGTSSVKPRVRHYTSFPAILSATYATPAPTASATTLPAGRVVQRVWYIKCTCRVVRWMGSVNGALGFSRSLTMAKTTILERLKCARHWYSDMCPSNISKEVVRPIRIF